MIADKIQVVTLTCDQYLDTRVPAVKETFGQNFDTIFLTDTPFDEEIVGYNTPKNYDGIQQKYTQFFLNHDFTKFDYYFFVDDDTYINHNNINNLGLDELDPEERFCLLRLLYLGETGLDMHGRQTGYPMHKIKGKNTQLPLYHPSGGAGFVLSRAACLSIQNFLKQVDEESLPQSGHSDVTVAFWMRECGVKLLPSDKLWWNNPESLYQEYYSGFTEELEKSAVTFHYMTPERMRAMYQS